MWSMDRPGEAAAFLADPDVALAARPTPLLIDEWHVVPGVLGAVKRAVDADPRPGGTGLAAHSARAGPTCEWPWSAGPGDGRWPGRRCRPERSAGSVGLSPRGCCRWPTPGGAESGPRLLLQALGVLDVVPAWSTNRLKRLTQRGKRYLTDGGLVAAALRTNAPQVCCATAPSCDRFWTPMSRPRSERRRPLRMRCRGSTTYGIGTVTRSTCCWTTGAAANLPSRSRRPLLRLDMTPGT